MERQFFKWNEMDKVNQALGIKKRKGQDKDLTAQRMKFARCKRCGQTMEVVDKSNVLICKNMVEKKIKKTLEDGTVTESIVNQPCGEINMVSKEYINYFEYLFM